MGRPKRSLGQNFLVDPAMARRIVEASGASAGEPILEIGPGRGALTGLLAPLGGPLLLLEKDDELAAALRQRFADDARIHVISDDAMRADLDALLARAWTEPEGEPRGGRVVRVVANLPYNVASRIALRLIAWPRLRDATFTFQREVALRFTAVPGNRDYGALTVMARMLADPFALFPIPPGAFRPVPKVDSHVVRFRPLAEPRVPPAEQRRFEAVVRGLFQTRRKTVANSLRRLLAGEDDAARARQALERCDIEPSRRPETLALEEFLALTRALEP